MFEQLETTVMRLKEVLNELSEPNTASNPTRFQNLMKEQAELTPMVELYHKYQTCIQDEADALEMMEGEADPDMKELLKEEYQNAKENKVKLEEELKIMLLPKDINDDRDVFVEIRGGAGGDEAALFAAELYRMYAKYAEGRGWQTEMLDLNESGIGGFKEATFSIKGKGVYAKLKYESGTHRVQRVPETESGGRIHTSTATVAIMPEAMDADVVIDPKDYRIDVFRASGAGGQHINKTSSAVRITHFPSGIVVSCQNERSQFQNRDKAMEILKTKLYEMQQKALDDERADLRRSQVGTGDRSEKIRTYNFPQGRVTDHRIKLTSHNLTGVLNGDLDEFIDALTAADQMAKLSKSEENF
ncbi:MAG: peptide chain release factor 1 [Lachnospiraceae bacterium]|nr:peptide chain release factor 1 [Candidatus Equihabitans merdae]